MKYEEIITHIRQRAGLDDRDEAARAATATLEILGQRLAGKEPSNLAAQLPADLKDPLTRQEGTAEDFDTDEFIRRVTQHGGGVTQNRPPTTFAPSSPPSPNSSAPANSTTSAANSHPTTRNSYTPDPNDQEHPSRHVLGRRPR